MLLLSCRGRHKALDVILMFPKLYLLIIFDLTYHNAEYNVVDTTIVSI